MPRVLLRPSVETLNRRCYTLVDERDVELAKSFHWWPMRRGQSLYAGRRGTYLHRLIVGAKKGQYVDHINGNGLDNRRSNLRIGSHSQNERNRHRLNKNNSSGVPGVSFSGQCGLWTVHVWLGKGERFRVAGVKDLALAREIRRAAEVIAYGPHAPAQSSAKGTYVGRFHSLEALKQAFQRGKVPV